LSDKGTHAYGVVRQRRLDDLAWFMRDWSEPPAGNSASSPRNPRTWPLAYAIGGHFLGWADGQS
jgi:hypothetical protein